MEEVKRNAVVISSYKYDEPFTDMNCAWSTCYTIFFVDDEEERFVKVGTGWGQDFEDVAPDVNLVDMTDEFKQKYYAYKVRVAQERAKAAYERFKKELDEYNASLRPQKIGQIVEVQDGKHKGKVGRITWFGKSKFNRGYGKSNQHWLAVACSYLSNLKPYMVPNAECDLILIRPVEGTFEDGSEKVYIDPSRCKVVEGFEEVTMTEEDCRRMNEHYDSISSKMHVGTAYDFHENV